MSQQSYIVAGGGLAGFSAAIELASLGHRVTLLEQSKQFGGRASTHHQQDFSMNIGPHGFYRAGVMRKQFDAWGIRYTGKQPLGAGRNCLIANGELHPFPAGTVSLLQNRAFSMREKIAIGQVLQKLPKMNTAAIRGQSMRDWIDSQASGNAALLLGALTRLATYSADLDALDAAAAIAQLQLALAESVLYLDGGWETLVAGLASKAESLGVEMRTQSGIVRVEPGGVELRTGERLAAAGIILAIPPKEVEHITGAQLPSLTPARAACLDLGLQQMPSESASFALGLEQPVYFSVHSLYAERLAPRGGALVQIAKYLGGDASATREELEQLADIVAPGWRDQLITSRFLPDMTVVHAIPRADSARPGVDALGLPNVMIAGDWVGPEAMLSDAAVASGLRAARFLAQRAAGKAA